ncbi:hypothetical protein [Pseudomonas oryzihabitans]|uniref:hypothetical protein n=1 Tax=Pseudomonas oryzihabitans TaxID=47885 RepID=UPI002893B709|nr:hypothetical protein [Pseudomonas oryzihabitans]MDT3721264.1 hypothetical protein [Pseudomonas oryzihabitans]
MLDVLLIRPDRYFRPELVKHSRTRDTLARINAIFDESQAKHKEGALIELCRQKKALGHKVLTYTVYSGTRETISRPGRYYLER